MSPKKFYAYVLLQWLIFFVLKIWFFNYQIFSNPGVQSVVYWAIVAAVAAALVRRLGVINFLESFYTIFLWVVVGGFLDLIITSKFTGLGIFEQKDFLVGFGVLAASVFLFHKKRHLHIRHALHEKAHAKH
jgi:hypothetical protein